MKRNFEKFNINHYLNYNIYHIIKITAHSRILIQIGLKWLKFFFFNSGSPIFTVKNRRECIEMGIGPTNSYGKFVTAMFGECMQNDALE